MTRRFEIGPLLIALAAVVLLVALFLRWYGADNAWQAFELTDVLLAALALACLAISVTLVVPELGVVDPRPLPWLVGAVLVVVAAALLNAPPTVADARLGTGAWMAFGAACVMAVGAVLTVGRVSLAVSVEGRDLRRRVSAVDHRPPPTESRPPVQPSDQGKTKARASEPLLRRRKAAEPEPSSEDTT
jgi:hypothetical protein